MAFCGKQVTLLESGEPYNLYELLLDAVPEGGSSPMPLVEELIIQSDPGNTGNVYVGDSTISELNYGLILKPGDGATFRHTVANIALRSIYLLSDANSQKVNVSISHE